MGAGLIDDFIRNILSIPFCPCHFVHTILSNAILSVYHYVHTILSVPFCPLPFCPRTASKQCSWLSSDLSSSSPPTESTRGRRGPVPVIPWQKRTSSCYSLEEEDQFLLLLGRRGLVPVTPWQTRASSCYSLAEEDQFLLLLGRRGPVPVTSWPKRTSSYYSLAEKDQFLLLLGRRGPVPVTPWQKRTDSCNSFLLHTKYGHLQGWGYEFTPKMNYCH